MLRLLPVFVRHAQLPTTALLALLLSMTACASKNPYEIADDHRRQGRCDLAVEEYSKAIAKARSDHELARAYYFRSRCHEELVEVGPAYADAYAALRVSCYLAATEREERTRPLGFIIGPAYCRGEGPARLSELGEGLTEQEALQQRLQAEQALPKRIREVPLPDHVR